MKVKELREKSEVELERLLAELREKVRDARFRMAGREFPDVREVRVAKQTIARILTMKTQREAAKSSKATA